MVKSSEVGPPLLAVSSIRLHTKVINDTLPLVSSPSLTVTISWSPIGLLSSHTTRTKLIDLPIFSIYKLRNKN